MKSSSPKNFICYSRKNTFSTLKLFLIGLLLSTKTIVTTALAGALVVVTVGLGVGTFLYLVVKDGDGEREYSGWIWKYDRTYSVAIGNWKIDSRWAKEQFTIDGEEKYLYTRRSNLAIQNPDPFYVYSKEPFTISQQGSSGDVPLEVRDFQCDWNQQQVNVRTSLRVRPKVKYIRNPIWYMPPTQRVAVVLQNWTPELQGCEEESRFKFKTILYHGETPSNGEGDVGIEPKRYLGQLVNLSSGMGSGIGYVRDN